MLEIIDSLTDTQQIALIFLFVALAIVASDYALRQIGKLTARHQTDRPNKPEIPAPIPRN